MSLLDLQDIGSKKRYRSSPTDYSKYLIIGVVIIGLISAMAITIPPFIATTCGGPVCGVDGNDYESSCSAALAFVGVKNTGSCIWCNDQDGVNEFISSSAISSNGTLNDVCIDVNTLNEAICENDKAVFSSIPCALGYSCYEGACAPSCLDNDGGINLEVKGTAILGTSEVMDECISNSVVKEYYCENNTIVYDEFDCEFGSHCDDGACIENACADSDGGKDVKVFGTITKGKYSESDSCEGILKIKEYYCNDGEIDYEIIDCQDGFECKNGKCQEMICSDSDSGLNQYVKGTTTLGVDSYTDSCYSVYNVLEYYCMDNAIKTTTLTCGSGSECVDGACKTVDCKKTVKDIDVSYVKYKIDTFTDVTVRLRETEIAELKGGYILELISGNNTTATFNLYKNLSDYDDLNEMCEFSINNGSSLSKYCGKTVTKLEITNSSSDFVSIKVGEAYSMQYYEAEGRFTNWTDSHVCEEDTLYYEFFNIDFLPYIATSNVKNELDLYNKKILLFEEEATIKEVNLVDKKFKFSFLGKTYTLEDGSSFKYKNHNYIFYLHFTDYGLERIEIELD